MSYQIVISSLFNPVEKSSKCFLHSNEFQYEIKFQLFIKTVCIVREAEVFG